jgi:hypothetical protein
MRDKDLEGIPQSITTPARDKLLAELGLVQLNHIRSVSFHPRSIELEVIATDDEGGYIAEGDELRVHTIVIPIVAASNETSRSDDVEDNPANPIDPAHPAHEPHWTDHA